MSPRQWRWAQQKRGTEGHGESNQARGPETQASWTPACPLPGHTCRVRRETAEGRGGEANRRAFVPANNSCQDSLPSWHRAGRLTWEGAAAAGTPSPKRHKQTQKGPASSSQPFLSLAPGVLTNLLVQAPRGPSNQRRKQKWNYLQKARAPLSGDHHSKQEPRAPGDRHTHPTHSSHACTGVPHPYLSPPGSGSREARTELRPLSILC